MIEGLLTNGALYPNSTEGFIGLNIKIKNGSDSCGNPHMEVFFQIPCLLVQVHGTGLSIYTVILADKITVDSYENFHTPIRSI